METHNHHCEVCERACIDAKHKVEKLQKKLQTMTIVMSVALTLAGEQVIKAAASYITSMKSVVGAANELSDVQNGKKEEKPAEQKTAWTPPFNWQQRWKKPPLKEGELLRPYQLEDELALSKNQKPHPKPKQIVLPEPTVAGNSDVTAAIVQAALAKELPLTLGVSALQFNDPYAVFLTPSTLPFDVYSTTLALGNNYGFGEYYGIGSGSGFVPPSIPAPSTLTVFGVSQFINLRKRT